MTEFLNSGVQTSAPDKLDLTVTVCNGITVISYKTSGISFAAAHSAAETLFGPCEIKIEHTRPEPDRAALEIVHSALGMHITLDAALTSPALATVINTLARRHMLRRARFDSKKLQANDYK